MGYTHFICISDLRILRSEIDRIKRIIPEIGKKLETEASKQISLDGSVRNVMAKRSLAFGVNPTGHGIV